MLDQTDYKKRKAKMEEERKTANFEVHVKYGLNKNRLQSQPMTPEQAREKINFGAPTVQTDAKVLDFNKFKAKKENPTPLADAFEKDLSERLERIKTSFARINALMKELRGSSKETENVK